MTTKVRLNVNLDADLKVKAAQTLNEMGMDMTTAITIYLKQIVRSQSIPFNITANKYYLNTEEVLGANWRNGLDNVEDEWE
jgi:DNA-damage-inducible protein J